MRAWPQKAPKVSQYGQSPQRSDKRRKVLRRRVLLSGATAPRRPMLRKGKSRRWPAVSTER